MDWINKHSKTIVFFAPISFSALYGLQVLLKDNQYVDQITFFLTTSFGLLMSVTGAALFQIAKVWNEERKKDILRIFKDALGEKLGEEWNTKIIEKFKDAMGEKLGEIPSSEFLNEKYGTLPDLFIDYLSNEKTHIQDGFKQLADKKEWSLITARSYQGITNCLRIANHIDIIDQDIRRWTEISLALSKHTFNPSQEILAITADRLRSSKNILYHRRVFMVKDDFVEQLEKEISAETLLEWKDIDLIVKILLIVWDFEKRIETKRDEEPELPNLKGFGTRVFRHKDFPNDMKHGLQEYKDIVILDNNMIFQEDLLYFEDTTSNRTKRRFCNRSFKIL